MVFTGAEWIYALIVHEIAVHHNPFFVLRLLKHSGKYTAIAIAAIILSFGAGMAVMNLIRKHASQKDIDSAMMIVKEKRGET